MKKIRQIRAICGLFAAFAFFACAPSPATAQTLEKATFITLLATTNVQASITNPVVDLHGFQNHAFLTLTIVSNAGTSATCIVKLEDSNTGTNNWNTVSNAYITSFSTNIVTNFLTGITATNIYFSQSSTGGFTNSILTSTITNNPTQLLYAWPVADGQRYVRLVCTLAGTTPSFCISALVKARLLSSD